MRVAVIGAGAAGLVCARELDRQNFEVTVFEQSDRVGGVWVYDSTTEDDPLGLSPTLPVFSSLYDSMRTNLPRDLMAFLDYTFDSRGGGNDYWQQYPHHSKVLEYLQNFANDFDILSMIQFQQQVEEVRTLPGGQWQILTASGEGEIFDAVAVCNGHYSKPNVPYIEGVESFKGQVLHSHNYRDADLFKGKRVVVLGTAASGVDIAREISTVAEAVFWCGEMFTLPASVTSDGINLYPRPRFFTANGDLQFSEEVSLTGIDVFIYCTGYEYQFPFIAEDVISVTENWVHPLYMDIIPPSCPNIAFIGLPFLVIPFPLFEIQAKWFSRFLAEKLTLPSTQVMSDFVEDKQVKLTLANIKLRHFHKLGENQIDYMNNLAAQCGEEPLPGWFSQLAQEAQKSRIADPGNFRDKPMQFHGPSVVKHKRF